MKKLFLVISLAAVGILTPSCAKNGTSPMPPVAGSMQGASSQSAAAASNVPQGWAATATQAVAIGGGTTKSLSAQVLPDTVPLRIVVGLSMRDPKGAQELVRNQYTPGGSSFHAWLSPSQFTAMFNPTAQQAGAVASYLRQQGLTNVTIEPNNLIVSATGSASRVASAFHTSIRTTTSNGQLVYGNVSPALVPAQFQGLVIAVLGLNNAYQMHTHILKTEHPRMLAPTLAGTAAVTAAGTPPPCLQVVNGVCEGGEYGPPQYQTAYDASKTACPNTCSGSNTSVAVMAEGNVSQVLTDLRTAEAFWHLPKVPYSVRKVGVSGVDTSGLDEWDLDTQISSGIAGTVKELYVYDTTSLSDSDIALEYSHWVNDDLAQAGNSSFGEPESVAFADGSMTIDDEELNQAASQGMTMFASTGDNGEGCPVIAATGAPNTGVPEVCYPAASPYAVAVGGTTLDTNADGSEPGSYYGEHVWIGTGGGISVHETAPYWQTNGICAGCTAGRGIADISMCADNNGCPMDVFVSGAQTGVGGTSLSSPMSMGIWARLETHFYNRLGFAAPVYYGVYAHYEPCPLGSTGCVPAGEPGSDTAALPPDTTAPIGGFHDILIGSNGIPSSAAPGWDTPTGLGSIDYCVMQQDIANSSFSGH
ncbi:MAG TPA: S53 family peptidase [Candidatus Baltobacteraceae bacterium]|nr:S53 family peptidase [Candidatus Baltobacteraceae bacterium]